MTQNMNELSLFTGAGGGVLGGLLLGWRTIGYVDNNDYCQRVLAQRIKNGHLHEAPIFGDIRAFIHNGYAARYRGLVDVISAGFPCQPFSVAGKRAEADDPRNMWPQTIECIRIVRPRYAYLENVPGLISSGYFGTILADLASIGYDARWCVLSAEDIGAPHKRERLWLVAYTDSKYGDSWVAVQQKHKAAVLRKSDYHSISLWGETPPTPVRMANGSSDRVERLTSLGNMQVPTVAAKAWQLLTQEQK